MIFLKTNKILSRLVVNSLAIRMMMGGGHSYKLPTQIKPNSSRLYLIKSKISYFSIFILFGLFTIKVVANNSNYAEIFGRVNENKTKNGIDDTKNYIEGFLEGFSDEIKQK